MEIGRLCVKIAGRDAGNLCVVVDQIDGNFVLIDGNVRRRKCNIIHLEPLDEVLKIKKGASHTEVVSEFKKFDLNVWNTKPKKKSVRQESKRSAKKEKTPEVLAKTEKKAEIKAEKPKSEKKESVKSSKK